MPVRGPGKMVVAPAPSDGSSTIAATGSASASWLESGVGGEDGNTSGDEASNPHAWHWNSRELHANNGQLDRARAEAGTHHLASRRRSGGGASSEPTAPLGCSDRRSASALWERAHGHTSLEKKAMSAISAVLMPQLGCHDSLATPEAR